MGTSPHLKRPRIDPKPITRGTSLVDLVDGTFLAYNGARLREACQLFSKRILEPDVTVAMSLTGTMVPAGIGTDVLVPWLNAGFVDWMITTGANLYHDVQIALGYDFEPDEGPAPEGTIAFHGFRLPQEAFGAADRFLDETLATIETEPLFGTARLHAAIAERLADVAKKPESSVLVAAHRNAVPLYASSPGDSAIGLALARARRAGRGPKVDPYVDVNETAAIVWDAKATGGKSAAVLLGGGSPKNFLLQTEPQIQEVLGLDEKGHDYFLQITDARPDTGGLSGATPGEAVSWGKVDPQMLPDTVVCYSDLSVALPILGAYALATRDARPSKRILDRRAELLGGLEKAYAEIRGA